VQPIRIVVAAAVMLLPLAASAQEPITAKVGKFTADIAVPESPAFSVLNLTPQAVTRPTSAQQLATSLLNGVDQNGNFQSGVAVDAQPYMLLYGHSVTWDRYRRSYPTRFLSRALFSAGTTKGASESDKSTKLALGVRLTLEAIDGMTAPTPGPRAPQAQIDAYQQEKLRRFEAAEAACRAGQAERVRNTVWNNSSMIVAVAPSWIAPQGNTTSLKKNGAGYWASFGYGFENIPGLEDSSQLLVQYRHRERETTALPADATELVFQDSDTVGLRWRVGTANVTGSFEYVFVRRSVRGVPDDNSSRLSVALERHVSGNTWLSVSAGTESGRADGRNSGFVLSSLAWSLNQKTQ
jgi:hypothetical protein